MLRFVFPLFLVGVGLQTLMMPIGWASMFPWQKSTLPAGSTTYFPTPAGGFQQVTVELVAGRRLRRLSCGFGMLNPPCRITSYLDSRILYQPENRTFTLAVTNHALSPVEVRTKMVAKVPWFTIFWLGPSLMLSGWMVSKTF